MLTLSPISCHRCVVFLYSLLIQVYRHFDQSLGFPFVFVSCRCYNKISQSWSLIILQIYSLKILEFRNIEWISLDQNQGVSKAVLPHEALGKNLITSLFQPQLRFIYFLTHGPIFKASMYHLQFPVWSSYCMILCSKISFQFPFIRTFVIICRAHPDDPG